MSSSSSMKLYSTREKDVSLQKQYINMFSKRRSIFTKNSFFSKGNLLNLGL